MSNTITITVSGVLNDLKNGLSREEIGAKYGLNKSQVKDLFQHPKLKNKKTIKVKSPAFILEDDTEEVTDNQLSMQDELDAATEVTAPADTTEGVVPVTSAVEDTPITMEAEAPGEIAPAISPERANNIREALTDAHTRRGVIVEDDTVPAAPPVPPVEQAQW